MIGFTLAAQKMAEVQITDADVEDMENRREKNAQEILDQEAAHLIFKLVHGYVNPAYYPFVKGEARSQMFMQQLEQIRQRYFEKLVL